MTPRQRRISADFEKIKSEFSRHPLISVEYTDSIETVPEKYIVVYTGIESIRLTKDSMPNNRKVEKVSVHKVEINLHLDYPKLKPQCFMLTEIFHPNVRMAHPNDICIGDYWAPGETLCDIIYLIGEMIMYQNYSISSPLNGIAAKWSRENEKYFPIDKSHLRLPEIDIEIK